MNLTMKQQQSLQAIDYKHKKFDARAKRIRYDSSSSTQSSATSSYELTTRSSDTPLSMATDLSTHQASCNKRKWPSTAPATAEQPAPKRSCLPNLEYNDSGFLRSTPTIEDDLRFTPAPPRYTSTPLSSVTSNTPITAITPLKRSPHHINDSGLSMTPCKLERNFTSTPHFAPYVSSPLAVLAAVAATTPSPKPTATTPTSTPTPTPTSTPNPTPLIHMPKISDETMHNICKYHGNMVRKFPKKERTPKDQERRNKNTIACRMSRRLKKLENVAIEEQYKEFTKQHFELVEASIRATAYLNALTMKLAAVGGSTGGIERPMESAVSLSTGKVRPSGLRKPKPFSIEYLTGQKESS